MKLWIRPPAIGATCFAFDVGPSDTVDDVKSFIRLRSNYYHIFISIDKMMLFTPTGHQLLWPHSTMSDYDIQPDTVLWLTTFDHISGVRVIQPQRL